MKVDMIIHRVNLGEGLADISKHYSVSQTRLAEDNGLYRDNLCEGEELIIRKPTLEALTRGGDTLGRLALRYGVKKNTLKTNNPSLIDGDSVIPGVMLAIKYQTPTNGPSSAIGIVTGNCRLEKFKEALPYLTYAVFMQYTINSDIRTKSADLTSAVSLAKEKGLQVLLGIELINASWLGDRGAVSLMLDGMIRLAEAGGYDGLYLCGDDSTHSSLYTEFILSARRAMIGRNLLLITGVRKEDGEIADLSDASVLTLSDELLSIGEYRELSFAFTDLTESSKVFVSLPDFGMVDGREYERDAIVRLGRRWAKAISTDDKTLISSFSTTAPCSKRQGGAVCFPSLVMIKELMLTCHELGYMGFAFNIETVPMQYLCLFNSLFTRADYNSTAIDE
ncbi:MAG: LysM peptidoglycan-binding domain-containing protein [Clostridia bacterium]|nr:LysM peptidoglycan-binding domain-containing protein [Clostridia bacterium]